MPRNRNPKLAMVRKQKEVITARLMQISLKLDDYVYNYIPIPTQDAEAYIQEVMGYQDICAADRRSSQVIEKLIRCMNGIIEEQNELQNSNSNATSTDVNMDEDLTQFTQEIKEIDAVLKEVESNKKSVHSKMPAIVNVNLNENMPLDLTVNLRNDAKNMEHKNQDVESLHRAVSELSIQDNDPLSIGKANFEECSQSVLADFNTNNMNYSFKSQENMKAAFKAKENMQPNITDMSRNFKDQYGKELELANSKDYEELIQVSQLSTVIDNRSKCPIIESNTRRRKLLNVVSLASNIADVRTTEFTADTQYEVNAKLAINKTKRKPKKITRKRKSKDNKQTRTKKTEFMEDGELENTKTTLKKTGRKITRNPRKPKDLDKQTKTAKKPKEGNRNFAEIINETQGMNLVVPRNEIPEDKFENIGINRTKYVKENGNTVATIQNFETKQWKNNVNIYEKNNAYGENPITYRKDLEYDLSWVENIRYVREISAEESVPSYYDDSFWSDNTLPNDWNDSQFL